MTNKKGTSYRLSDHVHALIEALADDMGSSKTQVVELAIRDLAKRRKVEAKKEVVSEDGDGKED